MLQTPSPAPGGASAPSASGKGRGPVLLRHPRHRHPVLRALCVGTLLALWAGAAMADPAGDAEPSAADREAALQPLQLEWGAPRLDITEVTADAATPRRRLEQVRSGDWGGGTAQAPASSLQLSRARFDGRLTREGMPSTALSDTAPGQSAQVEMNSLAYRWWFARGSSSLALGVGAATYRLGGIGAGPGAGIGTAADPLHGLAPLSTAAGAPLVSVGLRQRMSQSSLLYLDAASARQLGADDASEFYGARAGVEWRTSRDSTFALEQGRVRLRLYSSANSQMSLRVRKGGPMLVYRKAFD